MAAVIILEMPETEKDINILGNTYKLDITDFNILREIEELPSLNAQGIPTETQMTIYLQQYQDIFNKLFGVNLELPQKATQIQYFFMRNIIVNLYKTILDEQNKYLNINYPVYDVDKMLQITSNLAKIKEGEEN